MTTIISALKDYIATYTSLKADMPLWINFIGPDPTQYSITPLPGEAVEERYINDGARKVYPFAFSSMESTADELERLEVSGFFEAFSDWLETQNNAGVFPALPAGKTAIKIEATGSGYLYQEGQSETGVYQIQCRLTYEQIPL